MIRFIEFYIKEREKMKNKKVLKVALLIVSILFYMFAIRKAFWENVVRVHPSVLDGFLPVIFAVSLLCFVFLGLFIITFPSAGEKNEDVQEEQMNKHENESAEKESVEKKSEETIK